MGHHLEEHQGPWAKGQYEGAEDMGIRDDSRRTSGERGRHSSAHRWELGLRWDEGKEERTGKYRAVCRPRGRQQRESVGGRFPCKIGNQGS